MSSARVPNAQSGTASPAASSPQLQAAAVRFREYDFRPVAARQCGPVLYRDEYDTRLEPQGQRRFFWLLDYGVQLIYDAYDWRGEWRVDLVDISAEARARCMLFTIHDMTLDIVVEGMGPCYRMLDLDQIGQRLASGGYTPAQVAALFARTQRFLDAFLHRGAPWPPPAIVPFFSAQHNYSQDPVCRA